MPSQRVTISRNARRLQNKIRGTLQGHLPELETITPLLLHVQIRTPFVFTRWATQLHSKTYGLLYTTPRLYDTQQEAMYALLLWAYGLLSEDATWGCRLLDKLMHDVWGLADF
ncbi:hypothetical protein D6D08_10098 [Aureobasidium pullulans]|nr:hypothetical protein D6D08_10098 [Aureobasidium pullulans]